jgi:hypothetical protein
MWRGGHWYLDFFPMTTTRHLQQELRQYILQALMSDGDCRMVDASSTRHTQATTEWRLQRWAVIGSNY